MRGRMWWVGWPVLGVSLWKLTWKQHSPQTKWRPRELLEWVLSTPICGDNPTEKSISFILLFFRNLASITNGASQQQATVTGNVQWNEPLTDTFRFDVPPNGFYEAGSCFVRGYTHEGIVKITGCSGVRCETWMMMMMLVSAGLFFFFW